ncbi:MAG: phosphoglycerate mutase family protein [Bacteroidia bacterium]
MKQLYLVRHAKSDWNNMQLLDIDRPLNERGYSDAIRVGKFLKQNNFLPDVMVTSPAIRAISTALIFSRNIDYKTSELTIRPELYESSVKKYLACIAKLDNKYKSAMFFAHNPFISETANYLTDAFNNEMPTCAVVGITFNECNSWLDVAKSKGKLHLYEFPKNII